MFRERIGREAAGEKDYVRETWRQQPEGSENHEKRSLPERCKATEGAVRGVGLPEGSGIREIRSLPDGKTIVRASRQVQPPQSGPLDKLGDRIGLYGRKGGYHSPMS